MKTMDIFQNVKKLHQVIIVDAIHQAKVFIENHLNPVDEKLTVREKYSCTIFTVGSEWSPIVATSTSFGFQKPNDNNKTFAVPSFKITIPSKSIACA